MKRNAIVRSVLSVSLLLGIGATMSLAQEPAGQNAPASDNTKMNQRDRSSNEPTADHQSNNLSDRDITQQIRKSFSEDKTLSTYAHNVKVITQNGQVTLKGARSLGRREASAGNQSHGNRWWGQGNQRIDRQIEKLAFIRTTTREIQ